MKKIGFILSISVFILILTGCNGTVTKDLRHAGYNLSQTKLTCSDLIPKNEKEEAPKQISYMNGDMAITTDGEIYEMTFDKAYSNDENCRKASTDIIVTAHDHMNVNLGFIIIEQIIASYFDHINIFNIPFDRDFSFI